MPTIADVLSEEQLLQAYALMDSLVKADDEHAANAVVALKAFISARFMELTDHPIQHLSVDDD